MLEKLGGTDGPCLETKKIKGEGGTRVGGKEELNILAGVPNDRHRCRTRNC